MVLRDGVPMTDPDSFTRFDFIDTQDIQSIEIAKGPGSIFAAGSAGGTIHILSKSVFDNQQRRIKLGGGTYGTANLHGRYADKISENDFMAFTFSRRQSDNDWRRWNHYDSTQAGLKHGHLFGSGATLESELSYTEANMQLPGDMDEVQFKGFEKTGTQEETNSAWRHSGRYSTIVFFNTKYEAQVGDLTFKPRLYANQWEHLHPVTGAINESGPVTVYGTDLQSDWNHRLFDDEAMLIFGLTARVEHADHSKKYRYADLDTRFVTSPYPHTEIVATRSDEKGALMSEESYTNTLYGFYLQETLRPGERWLMDLSFRFDKAGFSTRGEETTAYDYSSGNYGSGEGNYTLDKTYDLASPRIGVSYRLTDTANLFATVARQDQTPSSGEFLDNRGLKASTSTNYEVGIKGRSPSFSYDLSAYLNPVQNEIVTTLDANNERVYQNAGETDKKGVELSTVYLLQENLSIGVNYAYSDYTYKAFEEVVYDNGATIVDRSGNRLKYIPMSQYTLFADYRHPSGLKAAVQSHTWGEYYMDDANTGKYDGYAFLTNLMLGYETGAHTITLNVNNLTDIHYAAEAKKSTSGDYSYAAGAPRTALLSYTYAF